MNINNEETVLSTIIATIGRPTLARAVESVLSQDSPMNFEVIVVNDSGAPLAAEAWHTSERVTILNTNHRERCIARNTGAAIAHGKYLHFLDDDDWMLPDAFQEFWSAARNNNAALFNGRTRVVDGEGKPRAEHSMDVDGNIFVQVMAGELLPLVSSFFESKVFFEVGGFRQRHLWAEDWDIGRRVALLGNVVNIHFTVACLVRDKQNSTTNYQVGGMSNIASIDSILDEKGSFLRMLASAMDDYWRGKMVRTYVIGTVWNLRNGKLFKALCRASEATASMILFATHIASFVFWKSIVVRHRSQVNS